MIDFNPLVSIVMPIYNGENYMREAIDSAINQTYKNIEVIVVNDGSTDNTENIARSYGDKIRYFKKENGGVATALNFAIENAKGEYISWLSHDDIYYTNKIESQVIELSNLEDKESIIFSNVTVINDRNDVIKHNVVSDKIEKSVCCFLAFDTLTGINGCSLLIPITLFRKYGYFNSEFISTQDYDLWFRFAKNGVVFHRLNEELVYSRIHEVQSCQTLPDITENADILHSNFIKEICFEEMKNYAEPEFYQEVYTVYYNSKYLRTAARISVFLFQYYRFFKKNKKAFELFNSTFIKINNIYTKNNFINIFSLFNTQKIKPRLLFYSNVWVKGGIERVLSNIFPNLIDDYEIILVTNFIENETGFNLPDKVKHIKVNKDLGEKLPYTVMGICFIIGADIFIGNPNIIVTFLSVYKLLKPTGIKTVAINHYNYFLPFSLKWLYPMALERTELLKYADCATWLTNFSLGVYNSINNNGYLLPNSNTFEVDDIDPKFKPSKNIICIGRFYDYVKRIDKALRVFSYVIKEDSEAKLLLVGDYKMDMVVDYERQLTLTMLLDELKIPKINIEFYGEVNDVRPYYEKASLLLVSSETEGFSIVINEAACFGIPTVYFEIPGLDDLIIDGINGFSIPKNSLKLMANTIVKIINNDELRIELSKNAKKLALRFTKERILLRWKELIDSLLTKYKKEFILFLRDQNKNNLFKDGGATRKLVKEYENIIFNLIDINSLRTEKTLNTSCPIEVKEKNEINIIKNILDIKIFKIEINNRFVILTFFFFIRLSIKIDSLVWWIPLKKLRNSVRDYMLNLTLAENDTANEIKKLQDRVDVLSTDTDTLDKLPSEYIVDERAIRLVKRMAITGEGTEDCLENDCLPVPITYYHPIPNIKDLEKREIWNKVSRLSGIFLKDEVFLKELKKLSKWADECKWSEEPTDNPDDFFLDNGCFSYGCASGLHSMIRERKSKIIMEVGSGNSSKIIRDAIRLNEKEGYPCEKYYIIDPYTVIDLSSYPSCTEILKEQVEILDPDFFLQLGDNDILFIDSSHVCKTGSDVNFEILDVLPILNKGVIIHFHDICLPYEYPKVYFTNPSFRVFWNESYLLQAFLSCNKDFEIILPMCYILNIYRDDFNNFFPNGQNIKLWSSGSFWIRRINRR